MVFLPDCYLKNFPSAIISSFTMPESDKNADKR